MNQYYLLLIKIQCYVFAGYYCVANTISFSSFLCDAGNYCPVGTQAANQHPCPIGTFNSLTQRTELADCLPCTGRQLIKFENTTINDNLLYL